MRQRWFTISSCLLVTALILGAAVWYVVALAARPQIHIDPTTYSAIKLGMTQEDVEAIIGGPPRDYTGGRFFVLCLT